MAISRRAVLDETRRTLEESFFRYFLGRRSITTGHFVLSKVFPDEYVIRSSIGGLETSFGTQFWEKLAKRLAVLNEFTILDEKSALQRPKHVPLSIERIFYDWKNKREDPDQPASMAEYVKCLNQKVGSLRLPKTFANLRKGTGVDLFLRKKRTDYAFDIKTVQLNAGMGPKLNQNLMEWHEFRTLRSTGRQYFKAYVVIPYDPTPAGQWWKKFSDRAAPLDQHDLLVGDEFWNLLSGRSHTLEVVNEAIGRLVSSGFLKTYKYALSSSSPSTDIRIIKYHFNCSKVSTRKPGNTSTIPMWRCENCDAKFKKSIPKIKLEMYACPNKCRSLG